LSQPEFSKSLV